MKLKKNLFFVVFFTVIVLFQIGVIFASNDGVYVLEPNDAGVLRPVLLPFQNGQVTIESGQTVYLDKSAGGTDGINSIGIVENAKIRKDGSGVIVEFNKNGFVSKVLEDKESKYEGLSVGSKISFDSSGKISKLDIQTLKPNTFNLNGYIYEVSAGTKLKLENSEVNIESKAGVFSYYSEKDLTKKQTFSNLKDGAKFGVDKSGKLILASFEVTKQTEVVLAGYKYNLNAGSSVKLENNKVAITVPDGSMINEPQKTSDFDSQVTFSFETKSGGALKLPNSDLFEAKSGSNVLYFRGEGFYFITPDAVINGENGQEEFKIYNKDSKEVYLAFDRSDLEKYKDKNSIFILNENGKDNLILNSISGEGPAIFFSKDNRYGFEITADNTITAQARNGRVFIEEGEIGKISSIKISGESISTLDKRSFYSEGGEMYFDPAKQLESNFNYGNNPASAKIVLSDIDGNKLKNFEVYSNSHDQYAAVPDGSLKNSLEFYKTDQGFYVSSTVAFNQLSIEQQKFYDEEINENVKQQLANYVLQNNGKEGVAVLQRTVENMRIEEEERRKNPYLASVRISSGGGSGTIVGVDKEGYPIVLTAGHLGSATSAGAYYSRMQLADGTRVTGTVLGGYNNPHDDSGWDVSLVRINEKFDKIAYVPVASDSIVLQKGENALRIGCPGCGDFKYTETQLYEIPQGEGTVGSLGYIYGGESGGGLFYKGRLVGVVSTGSDTTGHYSGPENLRNFLKQMGYGYLIKSEILFILGKI